MTAKKQIQQMVGAGVGAALGLYCGLMIFFPILGGGIAGYLAKRFAPVSFQPFLGALVIICGHAFWMLCSALLLAWMNQTSLLVGLIPISVDLIVMGAGIAWLLLRPGLGAVIFLSAFEILALIINVVVICTLEFGSALHKGLVLHIVLRLAALGLLYSGYRKFKANHAAELPVEVAPQSQGTGQFIF